MIKVCGIRSEKEAEDLKDLDVDFFGLIFAKSERKVDIKMAKKILLTFKSTSKKVVGVFTDVHEVKAIENEIDLDVYQLHGEFSASFCESLLGKGKEVWRVFRVKDKLPDFGEFEKLFRKKNFYPLFDTKGEKMGGNGEVFEHKILSSFSPNSFIIAGGLGADNCLLANKLNPYVLDFNSKVETDGKKDRGKIEKIIKLLRNQK